MSPPAVWDLQPDSTARSRYNRCPAVARIDRHRPAVQQLELQAQLRDLLLRRPVARVRHGARGEAIDECDEGAQDLLARLAWPLRPLLPRDIETALEEPQVLAVHPGIDALQALIRGDLAPEGDPERTLNLPVGIDRQRFEQQLQQVGTRRA